ncbi:hypothetical protein Lepto7375DRAFT_7431 [Leptolyngbya sp. PCC 7375]|nr:hypothetical protein Lepto7375DRAFT_7431 [Leptolyngbya sp. PCC 7375]
MKASVTRTVYATKNNPKVRASLLRGLGLRGLKPFLKNIANGWWDCKEAAADWWDLLSTEMPDAREERGEFRVFMIKPLFDTLGAPSPLPDYETPWDFFLYAETYRKNLLIALGGES